MSEQEQTPRETLKNWLVSLRSGLYVAPSEVREAIRAVLAELEQARSDRDEAISQCVSIGRESREMEEQLRTNEAVLLAARQAAVTEVQKAADAEAGQDALRATLAVRGQTLATVTKDRDEWRQACYTDAGDRRVSTELRAEVERLTVLHGLAQGAEIRSVARAERAEAALREIAQGRWREPGTAIQLARAALAPAEEKP